MIRKLARNAPAVHSEVNRMSLSPSEGVVDMIPNRKRAALSRANPASTLGEADISDENAIRTVKAISRWLAALYGSPDASRRNTDCQPTEADQIRLHGLGVRW